MRTGTVNLPLHYGKAPRWLFERMTLLAREITIYITSEFGPKEMLRKLSDPGWFQSLGCVLGFDWHSSGLTTTTCGALKEGTKEISKDLGLFFTGGKGRTSRKTPLEIEEISGETGNNPQNLIYASKMAAKVDSAALQDDYQLYHHVFVFTQDGSWSVVQQGMNDKTRYARRYHWLSNDLNDFVCEPHKAICSDSKGKPLNMVALESKKAREVTTELSCEPPHFLITELGKIQSLNLSRRHQISFEDINPKRLEKIFLRTYEEKPKDFERLLGMKGVGPKTIRALSLISELVYGVAPSFKDPVRFSFAHGGKDGYPYPVDKGSYDQSIEVLRKAISASKLGQLEKMKAIRRLYNPKALVKPF